MFAHHRKRIQLLFAAADAFLTVFAFEAAYLTRTRLSMEKVFFLHHAPHLLLLSFCAVVWVAVGSFQRVYEYLDSTNPRRVIFNTIRQGFLSILLVIIFQYLLQLEHPPR